MKILLGMTGSVATTIAPKIVEALRGVPCCRGVSVVMTESACRFYDPAALNAYTESDEWYWVVDGRHTHKWSKGSPVLHVNLAKEMSAIVIAPATANTIGKMANGLCDNLLMSTFTARRWGRPVIIAPAMNSSMWESKAVQRNVQTLIGDGIAVVRPTDKHLACGDYGVGAMADVTTIASVVADNLRWSMPIPASAFRGIPIGNHPGAFGAIRKHDRHTGVDLYCDKGTVVRAVEPGVVVAIEDFTGKDAGCPWWLDTRIVKVEGPSGIVGYGEIEEDIAIRVGVSVGSGTKIGQVVPVLPPEKHRPDVPGHSCSMLHLQVYERNNHADYEWEPDGAMPHNAVDPTPYLMGIAYPELRLEMEEVKSE